MVFLGIGHARGGKGRRQKAADPEGPAESARCVLSGQNDVRRLSNATSRDWRLSQAPSSRRHDAWAIGSIVTIRRSYESNYTASCPRVNGKTEFAKDILRKAVPPRIRLLKV